VRRNFIPPLSRLLWTVAIVSIAGIITSRAASGAILFVSGVASASVDTATESPAWESMTTTPEYYGDQTSFGTDALETPAETGAYLDIIPIPDSVNESISFQWSILSAPLTNVGITGSSSSLQADIELTQTYAYTVDTNPGDQLNCTDSTGILYPGIYQINGMVQDGEDQNGNITFTPVVPEPNSAAAVCLAAFSLGLGRQRKSRRWEAKG